jgi:hypothetical protein
MRHLLHDPAYPDLVGAWAAHEAEFNALATRFANDNGDHVGADELSDPFLDAALRQEIAATRLW